MRRVLAGVALLLLTTTSQAHAACEQMFITGYTHTGNLTASGRSTYGNEWAIAAAHPRFPFGTILYVQGVGSLVVADRGHLGWSHVDVLVPSVAQAYDLTSHREVCW